MKYRIGWIGTGLMGAPMARHLASTHDVVVYNRTAEKARALLPTFTVAENPEQIVAQCDIIFTMLGMPEDVKSMYEDILIPLAKPGTILIDATTSSPRLARHLNHLGKTRNVFVFDAPVTGGVSGATNGTLTTMVGGDPDVFKMIRPLLEKFTKTLLYMGEAGQGQQTKLANQIAIAGALASLAEALAFAEASQLPMEHVLTMIQSGAASSYASLMYGPKMLKSDYEATFFVRHYLKDLRLALEETPIELPILSSVYRVMDEIAKQFPYAGVQAIIAYYRDLISRKVDTK